MIVPKTEVLEFDETPPRREANILDWFRPTPDERAVRIEMHDGDEMRQYASMKEQILESITARRGWYATCAIFEFIATMFNKEMNRGYVNDAIDVDSWYRPLAGYDAARKYLHDADCCLYDRREDYAATFPNFLSISSCNPYDLLHALVPHNRCAIGRNLHNSCSLPLYYSATFNPLDDMYLYNKDSRTDREPQRHDDGLN